MKGIVIVRDFLIFIAELAVLLFSLVFITQAGSQMGDFVFNFDSRVASETIFGFEAAADMSGGNFEAGFTMPANPYKLSIGTDNGNYFVLIDSSRETFHAPGGVTIKFQKPRKLFLIHTIGNNLAVLDGEIAAPAGGKMSESQNWRVDVKRVNNDISVSAIPLGAK
ncbi:MAG: hypothetical protein V1836_03680 [Candidatus Aenigmatarchaeota archaeon]